MLKIIVLAAVTLMLSACVVPVGHRDGNDRSDSGYHHPGDRHDDREDRERDRRDDRRDRHN